MFRDCDQSVEFHLDLSRVFGPLEVHRTKEFLDDRYPELLLLNSNSDNTEIEVDGQRGGQYQSWHKDLFYAEKVNRGGILRALKPTSRGGLTGFMDLADAYDRLSAGMRARIADLRVVYKLSLQDEAPYYTRSDVRVLKKSPALTALFARRERDFPAVSHPLVFTDPASGRTILNFSPGHARYVEGLSEEESHELLWTISGHVFESPAYHHKWSTEEMLLWDNWRILHMVSLQPLDEERIMQRTTIMGDYGLGRRAPDAEAAARIPVSAHTF
jgi:taurine dioxygenase